MITYAGEPLCIEDLGGGLRNWMDKFLPLDNMRDQSMLSPSQVGDHFPQPNYPDPPPPKINTLYWPTGAARWARGYFLATRDALTNIRLAIADDADKYANLVMKDDESEETIKASMFMLPPRPIPSTKDLYLLPLVDKRYWWQYMSVGDLSLTTATTWATLRNTVADAMGIAFSIASEIDADYLKPDAECFNSRRYCNAAVAMDAIAHSIGQRVVVDLAGGVNMMSWLDTAARFEINDAFFPIKLGGESFPVLGNLIPANVVVAFQKLTSSGPNVNGEVHAYTVNASDVSVYEDEEELTGADVTIKSKAFADFTTEGSTPDNNDDLDSLSKIIATDYYSSILQRYDHSFSGIPSWSISGYDDHVLYSFFSQRDDTGYDARTRVQTSPYNFGIDEMLHQDSTLHC